MIFKLFEVLYYKFYSNHSMEFRREIFQFSGHIKKAADYGAQ